MLSVTDLVGTGRFAPQIVTKPHLITVFDEQVGADSLLSRHGAENTLRSSTPDGARLRGGHFELHDGSPASNTLIASMRCCHSSRLPNMYAMSLKLKPSTVSTVSMSPFHV